MKTNMPEQLLSQKRVVEQYLGEDPNSLSVFSFTNIFAWQDFFQFDFKVIRDSLCVFAKNPIGCFLYLPPFGKNVTPDVIDECFEIMEGINQGSGVTRIENVSAKQLAFFPQEKFAHSKKGYEYCYYKKDIVALQGNLYKSKRSSYNQFVNNYTHCYVPYEEDMIHECMDLYRDWAGKRKALCSDDIYGHMLEENARVHELVLRHHQQLDLIGRVVKVNDRIKAYSFGFPVNEDVFCVLFEVADLDIKGLPVYIFREFCRDAALQKYKFINVMDDFGLDNIRHTKMSFHPRALLPMYVVTRK